MIRSTIIVGAASLIAIGMMAGAGLGRWLSPAPATMAAANSTPQSGAAAPRTVLYYRDPSGAPYWSAGPKQDASGRDYIPVHDEEDVAFEPPPAQPASTAASRKILYYRNPMGLPDTSPVPKKDSMGMDYIAVYDGDDDDSGGVKVSPAKVQRSGVRTETVLKRQVARPVRGVGTVTIDERLVTIVTMRSEGFIEDLFVNVTGQPVRAGEPLFRVYSPDIQRAQVDLLSAMRAGRIGGNDNERSLDGAMMRLRNLGVPQSRIREVRETGANSRVLDWPAPAGGTVIAKRIINGQRVMAGDELYRIADLSQLWVIAEVAESDVADIAIGGPATVTLRAYPTAPIEGRVSFIQPEIKPETRTARVRIEVPNPDGKIRIDMYADIVFQGGSSEPVVAVPESAVIDSGTRQVVLVAKDDGRFEPRPVKLGQRGDGHVAILDGLQAGETVVSAGAFLIDAESNLRAALKAFQPGSPK